MATYTLIEAVNLTGSQASVVFSTIPSTYTDLVIQVSARSTEIDNASSLRVYFNADTANIGVKELRNIGSSTATYSLNYAQAGYVSASQSTTNTFGSATIYVPNCKSGNYKISSGDISSPSATVSENYNVISSRLWSVSSAITSITVAPSLGSWVQHSGFYLYGISNA